jgi:MFS family permease
VSEPNRSSEPPPGLWQAIKGYPGAAFLICLVGASFANMDQAFFAFVLTEIMEEFGWTLVERGWYIAITFSIAGACIVGLGVLADRVGRKRVFEISILVSSLFVTALRWAPNTFGLVVLRTLGFASGGIQSPVTGTIVVEESPPRYRGLLSGVLQIGYPIGFFLASLLAAPIYSRFGWRNIFLVGLLSIPYMAVVHFFLRETKPFLEARRVSAERGGRARIAELFGPELRLKTLALFSGEFLFVFAYGASLLLTAYFREGREWAGPEAIRLVGFSYGVGALGYVLAAVVGEFWMTRRNTIILWSWLGGAAFTVMIWLTESWWPTAISFFLTTVFFYGTTAVKFTFIAESFPSRLRATGVTLAGSLAVNLGVALGPLCLSYSVAAFGWEWAFTLCGVLPIFASSLFFFLLRPLPRGAAID